MSAATDMNDSAKASFAEGKPSKSRKTKAQNSGRPATSPAKTGRPTTFSQEIADRICDHIANGGYATKLERFGLPSSSTLGQWLNQNPTFAAEYARARERRAEHFADEMVEIADTADDPAKARLQVETRKWVASKLFPRMYGENQRVEVQHTISETAARVLQDLAQRQKQRKAEEAKYIDVTPVHSLAEGRVTPAISTGCEGTARIAHGSDAQDEAPIEPPGRGSIPAPPSQQRPSLSEPTPEKNISNARNANADRQRRYRERQAALKKSAAP